MKGINIYNADTFSYDNAPHKVNAFIRVNRKLVLARPLGNTNIWFRLKCVWKVFTGKADLLTWTKQ